MKVFREKKIRVTEMDYVTGLARKVKGQGPDVGLSPGSRNATDFVSLFFCAKKSIFVIKAHFRRSCRFQFVPLNRFFHFNSKIETNVSDFFGIATIRIF